MTNDQIIDKIRDITKDELCTKEIDSLLDELEETIDYNDQIEELKEQLADKEDKIEELESELEDSMRDYESHFVGMDTIYISFDKGNYEIKKRVEIFIDRLKQHYGATIS